MLAKSFLACLSVSLLTGCITLPEFSEDEISTALVIQNIKCEFRDAVLEVDPKGEFFKNWNSIFNLTLGVNQKGSVTADGSLTHPIVPTIFTLPFGATLTGDAQRTEKIEFVHKVPELREPMPFYCPPADAPRDRHAMLGGRIGIRDLLARARVSAFKSHVKPTQLDYTLDFGIVKNANIGPRFSMIPLRGADTLTAGIKVDGTRTADHTLTIVMKRSTPGCPAFPKFYEDFEICPTVVATVPLAEAKDPKTGIKPLAETTVCPSNAGVAVRA